MHFFGEQIEDTTDGGRSCRCVDRTKNQVPRFGCVNSSHKRFLISHFTNKDDVWVFPHGVLHRYFKVLDVRPNFALIDEAFFFGVDELDWVLERQNVFAVLRIDPIEHRCDRRAFSGTRNASQQHHPLIVLA